MVVVRRSALPVRKAVHGLGEPRPHGPAGVGPVLGPDLGLGGPGLHYARFHYALNRKEVDGWKDEFTSRFGLKVALT
jgi:hypothetical protein